VLIISSPTGGELIMVPVGCTQDQHEYLGAVKKLQENATGPGASTRHWWRFFKRPSLSFSQPLALSWLGRTKSQVSQVVWKLRMNH